ncbi:MAG: hypothetical protein PHE68_02075 [Candidatus Peribacteraceae bacterium]|nr:hypothetical protein [Candidatus Peribacteraceae bacterium]MDD5074449.1 hypothetical protein [Candidatus Peribacteraceae bacterium]
MNSIDETSSVQEGASAQADRPARHIALRTAVERIRGGASGIVYIRGVGLPPDIDAGVRSIRTLVNSHRDETLAALQSCLGGGMTIDIGEETDHILDLADRYAGVLSNGTREEVCRCIRDTLDLSPSAGNDDVYHALMKRSPAERDAAIAAISHEAFTTRPSLASSRGEMYPGRTFIDSGKQ